MSLMLDISAVILAHAIGAWLTTYLLHSTVLILLAHGLERISNEPALHAVGWRTAIIGPLFTASLHTAVPFGSPFRFSTEPAGAILGPRPGLALMMVAVWCALIANRLIGLVRAEVRAHAAMGRRRASTDPQHLRMVAARAESAGLRRIPKLTTSQRILSPAALATGEICVPQNIFGDLSAAEQNALLAHEMAHHVHRDPAWCGAATAVAAVCCFQPLNRQAVRHLRRASEYVADARAVRDTGDPLALARALAALAPHALRGARVRTAATGSPLLERIERILDEQAPEQQRFSRSCATICVVALLGACLTLGPGVNFRPDNAANTIPALTPSRAEPTPQMLELRQLDRKLRHVQRTIVRGGAAALTP